MQKILISTAALLIAIISTAGQTRAADSAPADELSLTAPFPATLPYGTYGPFNLLNHDSAFGTGFFPEPFLVDEGDRDNELALTWIHLEGHGTVSDNVTAEVEFSLGDTTFEIEGPYQRDTLRLFDPISNTSSVEREEGIASPQITARHPIWQYLSADGKIDNTLVLALEVAVPTNGPEGRDTELVPGFFDLLRIGDRFGLQTHVGFSTLLGPDPANQQTLEYSVDFSYEIFGHELGLPREIFAVVPIFEIAGERGLNKGDYDNSLTAVIGARFNLKPIGTFEPRFGIGCIFPLNSASRQNQSWGVITSLLFDL